MLVDNKGHGSVQDILAERTRDAGILSVLTSSFSIYAFEGLRDTLVRLSAAKLLLPASQANDMPSTASAIRPPTPASISTISVLHSIEKEHA